MTRRTGGRARDAVVTGIGLCLPGPGSPVFTADDLWDVASTGTSCLIKNDIYYGSVDLPGETFDERVPGVPEFFSRHYTDAHRFGLVSLAQACADAGLETQHDLEEAAILVGRGGVDANVDSYLAVLGADPATYPVTDALEMSVAAEQAITPRTSHWSRAHSPGPRPPTSPSPAAARPRPSRSATHSASSPPVRSMSPW